MEVFANIDSARLRDVIASASLWMSESPSERRARPLQTGKNP
jgi:hypothetical protein